MTSITALLTMNGPSVPTRKGGCYSMASPRADSGIDFASSKSIRPGRVKVGGGPRGKLRHTSTKGFQF
ncbi:hypothetical protein CVT26_015679 [Gymnopilus dilepis]|uniref:Uncharacterized protein n=1 Tax=Gymnopilus dilepis TaxID=231916 RepID=A0A409VFD6_9AGAR|nr:hypothetical protein CVT26_015679 [Gymnopilus dilepis]